MNQRIIIAHDVVIIALLKILLNAFYVEAYENVYGSELQKCSQNGMALSGYTRTGYCVDEQDDSGSHHICIDLSSTNGGNFCDVTGQSDWCSSYMQCDESDNYSQEDAGENNDKDGDENDDNQQCLVQNWCVCQWAFANYIEAAGGCDAIQDVVCDSINAEAVKAYIQKKNKGSKYTEALDCIVERCGVDLTLYGNVEEGGYWSPALRNYLDTSSLTSRSGVIVVLLGILGLVAFALQKFAIRSVGPMSQPILNQKTSQGNSVSKYDCTIA